MWQLCCYIAQKKKKKNLKVKHSDHRASRTSVLTHFRGKLSKKEFVFLKERDVFLIVFLLRSIIYQLLTLRMSYVALTAAALCLSLLSRQEAADDEAEQLERRRRWEDGRMEYLGRDAFQNIQRMLDSFLK